jgi:secondary thiamine-phosphate synthase enzyme
MSFESITIQTKNRVEFVNITSQVKRIVGASGIEDGDCTVYCPHTTAGITINEAADPAVVHDIIGELEKIVPFEDGYSHSEGNSAAHIKSTLVGTQQTIPIHRGQLTLGTWQGIFFCEFDGSRSRKVYISIRSA